MRQIVRGIIGLVAIVLATNLSNGQVTAHSGIVSADGFYFHIKTDECFTACSGFTLGGTAGYNVTNYLGLFGEYQYDRAGVNNVAAGNNSGHANNFGGALRVYLYDKGRVVPYGVFGGGGLTSGSTAGPLSNAKYFGGGWRCIAVHRRSLGHHARGTLRSG